MAASASRRARQHLRLWLRLHGASERRLAHAAAQFFRQQGARILEHFRGHGTILPLDITNAINWHVENERFLRTVARPQLLAQMTTGARVALQGRPKAASRFRAKSRDDGDDDTQVLLPFAELPDAVKTRILTTLDITLRQPYWEKIQRDQRDSIQDAIRDALDEGTFGERALARAIRDVTDGDVSLDRAARIARTETTGALNAGHAAALEDLEESGDSTGRTWLAIEDKSTRPSHEELDGETVPAGEDFVVGDDETRAPYPGWHGLPPEERINCRCTIVGGVG